MILTYRYVGIALLFIGSASFCSLLARYEPEIRSPIVWLAILAMLTLSMLGLFFYSSRQTNPDWLWYFGSVVGVAVCITVGAILQWV